MRERVPDTIKLENAEDFPESFLAELEDADALNLKFSLKHSPYEASTKEFLENYEQYRRSRGKKVYLDKARVAFKMIVLNLIWARVCGEHQYVHYSRSNRFYPADSNLNPNKIGWNVLKDVIDWLETENFIEHYRAKKNTVYGKRSRIRGTKKFFPRFPLDEKVVEQLRPQYDAIKITDEDHNPIGFKKTPGTDRMVKVIQAYNSLLQKTEIKNVHGLLKRKQLCRIFKYDRSFKYGGRFFGAEFQTAKRKDRSSFLINGEKTCGLDFHCMYPAILYGQKGLALSGDAYEIDIETSVEDPRKLVKKALLICFNVKSVKSACKTLLKEWAKDKTTVYHEEKKKVRETAPKIFSALEAKHTPIADSFYNQRIGMHLMNIESRIAEHVISGFLTFNEVVLCIHDGFVCAERNEQLLRRLMEEAFRKELKNPTLNVQIKKEFP